MASIRAASDSSSSSGVGAGKIERGACVTRRRGGNFPVAAIGVYPPMSVRDPREVTLARVPLSFLGYCTPHYLSTGGLSC